MDWSCKTCDGRWRCCKGKHWPSVHNYRISCNIHFPICKKVLCSRLFTALLYPGIVRDAYHGRQCPLQSCTGRALSAASGTLPPCSGWHMSCTAEIEQQWGQFCQQLYESDDSVMGKVPTPKACLPANSVVSSSQCNVIEACATLETCIDFSMTEVDQKGSQGYQRAYRRLMPGDGDPWGDGAVHASQVVQQP